MKTLIINGSPRKNGDTITLVNEMMKYIEGEVRVVHTYYSNIRPCTDCRYCWENDKCVIDDEMQEVYKYLEEADNVVLASPLYFSELTGQLLSFASRLQLFFAARFIRKDTTFQLKKKKGVLIISAGGSTKNYEHCYNTANIIFKEMNAELIGTVSTIQTDKVPAKEDSEALIEAMELAQRLNNK